MNTGEVQDPAAHYADVSWRYKSAKNLNRLTTDALVEREVIRINPTITEQPKQADEASRNTTRLSVTNYFHIIQYRLSNSPTYQK